MSHGVIQHQGLNDPGKTLSPRFIFSLDADWEVPDTNQHLTRQIKIHPWLTSCEQFPIVGKANDILFPS
jgi:hypothetical protein